MHMPRLNRHNHPKTYQLTKPMEFRTRLGIRKGGVAIRVHELYFPRDQHLEIQSQHSLGESNPQPYDL